MNSYFNATFFKTQKGMNGTANEMIKTKISEKNIKGPPYTLPMVFTYTKYKYVI